MIYKNTETGEVERFSWTELDVVAEALYRMKNDPNNPFGDRTEKLYKRVVLDMLNPQNMLTEA